VKHRKEEGRKEQRERKRESERYRVEGALGERVVRSNLEIDQNAGVGSCAERVRQLIEIVCIICSCYPDRRSRGCGQRSRRLWSTRRNT
jgi:hypothetical protein